MKRQMDVDKKALGRIIASHRNPVLGYFHMVLDKRNLDRHSNQVADTQVVRYHNRRVISANQGTEVGADDVASTRRALYPARVALPQQASPARGDAEQGGGGMQSSLLTTRSVDQEDAQQPPRAQQLTGHEEADQQLVSHTAPLRTVPFSGESVQTPAVELDDDNDDRARRIEWIKFYVRTEEPHKARALGWDGKPFRGMERGSGLTTGRV